MARASFHHSASRGFTLTELALVLGIIGLVLAGIWVAAASVYANNRNNQARDQTVTIINNWRSLYGGRTIDMADGADITQLTVSNGFAPSNMGSVSPSCTVGTETLSCMSGPWSGSQVTVQAWPSKNGFSVTYSNLSQDVCNSYADLIINVPELIETTIDGHAGTYPPYGTNALPTFSQISDWCEQPDQINAVQVIFSRS